MARAALDPSAIATVTSGRSCEDRNHLVVEDADANIRNELLTREAAHLGGTQPVPREHTVARALGERPVHAHHPHALPAGAQHGRQAERRGPFSFRGSSRTESPSVTITMYLPRWSTS